MTWNLLLSQTDHYKPKQVLSWFIVAWITMTWNLLLSQTDHYKPEQVLYWFITARITIFIATRSQKTN